MAEVDSWLEKVKDLNASDLHLRVGSKPTIRLHGELIPLDESMEKLTADSLTRMLEEIMAPEQLHVWHETYDIDFSYEVAEEARFRVNTFMTRVGPGAAFRYIPVEIKTSAELGLPQPVLRFADYRKGLVLVTGATGSGKSTTLSTIINHINEGRKEHILTIEDPIEFVHQSKNCLVSQREVGPHTKSFATALRAALREDPDVILVGEMRDVETIELALTAAETGHLVFATLHTNSAADSIDRIINVFPEAQQDQIRQVTSNVLIGVVSQNLLKKKDKSGRVVAIEIMVGTPAIANLIREGKSHQVPSVIQTGKKDGMQTMDQHLMELVQSGTVSAEEAIPFARQKEMFFQYLGSTAESGTLDLSGHAGGEGSPAGEAKPATQPQSPPPQQKSGGFLKWK